MYIIPANPKANNSRINVFFKPTIRVRCVSDRNGIRHRSRRFLPVIRLVRLVSFRTNGKKWRGRNGRGFNTSLTICATGFRVTRHCNNRRLVKSRSTSRWTPLFRERVIVTNRKHATQRTLVFTRRIISRNRNTYRPKLPKEAERADVSLRWTPVTNEIATLYSTKSETTILPLNISVSLPFSQKLYIFPAYFNFVSMKLFMKYL